MSPPHRDDQSDPQTPMEPLMDPAERDRLLRQVHRALIGDPLSRDPKKQGLVAIVTQIHRDIYGDDETKVMGMKDMTLKMWESRIKLIGGTIVVSAVVSGLGWVIMAWLSYRKP